MVKPDDLRMPRLDIETMIKNQLIEGCPRERRATKIGAGFLTSNPRARAVDGMTTIYVDRCGNWYGKDGHRIERLFGGADPWRSPPAEWRKSDMPEFGPGHINARNVVDGVILAAFWAFDIPINDERLSQLAAAWIRRLERPSNNAV